MGFVQILEYRTTRPDEVRAIEQEYEQATKGRSTVRRSVVTQDRNDPSRFVIIVFFDSYESAMQNSNLPETGQMAGKITALLEGPPVFHDLDVIDDMVM